MNQASQNKKFYCISVFLAVCCSTVIAAQSNDLSALSEWIPVQSAITRNDVMEARIAEILAAMTLPQKIGQMTQAEIGHISPDQVKKYYIGSVLNGGGSWPKGNRIAAAKDWVELADSYYSASMSTDMTFKVPVIWGTDAMHGHGNVYGSTLFPHNIGLGATRDSSLVEEIGSAVARQVRATGIDWVFAPTVAVAQDVRWGRTYESFSEDPKLVNEFAQAYVKGLQGRFQGDGKVVATAKHFLADGATSLGIDQGQARISQHDLINVHAAGYAGALTAGVQTVMASLSSWYDPTTDIDYGKMHGNKYLLTDVLKSRLGFDGFVVTDWDGISQVSGCSRNRCAQAINAGIDMVMVPEDWQAFISNTIDQVQRGDIPMERIDDAVSRILRVKLRAGLFQKKPSEGQYAGQNSMLLARSVARKAVRESLVLLKNDGHILPLSPGQHILVVGKSAHNLPLQTGGWSMTWQGTETTNADFPMADSIFDGIREKTGNARVEFSETAKGIEISNFDAVIAVIGERPYAEFVGDITLSSSLRHSSRYPEDLNVLQAVSGRGVPVITVLLSGRPVYSNDLLNLSAAFVAAWLPGSEGKGVADMLFRQNDGMPAYDFTGKLPFSWPKTICQSPIDRSHVTDPPLFSFGYGLTYQSERTVGMLELDSRSDGCGKESSITIFNQADHPPYALYVSSAANNWDKIKVSADPHVILDLPTSHPSIRVETAQINVQHDAKKVTWYGPARFFAAAAQKQGVRSIAMSQGILQFDMQIEQAPKGNVTVAAECGLPCRGELDLTKVINSTPLHAKRTIKIPLLCLEDAGADFLNMDIPFSIYSAQSFSALFTKIQLISSAAMDADTLSCAELNASGQ